MTNIIFKNAGTIETGSKIICHCPFTIPWGPPEEVWLSHSFGKEKKTSLYWKINLTYKSIMQNMFLCLDHHYELGWLCFIWIYKHVTHGNNETLDVLWQCHHIHFAVVTVDLWPPGSLMSAQGPGRLLVTVMIQSTRGRLYTWWMWCVVPRGRMKVVRISVAFTLENKPLYFHLQKVVSNAVLKYFFFATSERWAWGICYNWHCQHSYLFFIYGYPVKIITALASPMRNYWRYFKL